MQDHQTRPYKATARPPQADRRKPDRPGQQQANSEGITLPPAERPDPDKPARPPKQSHHRRTAQTTGSIQHVGGKGGLRIDKLGKANKGKRSGIPTWTGEVHNAAPGSPGSSPLYRFVTLPGWLGEGSPSLAWDLSQADRLSAVCRGVVRLW